MKQEVWRCAKHGLITIDAGKYFTDAKCPQCHGLMTYVGESTQVSIDELKIILDFCKDQAKLEGNLCTRCNRYLPNHDNQHADSCVFATVLRVRKALGFD